MLKSILRLFGIMPYEQRLLEREEMLRHQSEIDESSSPEPSEIRVYFKTINKQNRLVLVYRLDGDDEKDWKVFPDFKQQLDYVRCNVDDCIIPYSKPDMGSIGLIIKTLEDLNHYLSELEEKKLEWQNQKDKILSTPNNIRNYLRLYEQSKCDQWIDENEIG